MTFDYYKAPSDEVFNEIKRACIELWSTYDDTHGYASEKIDQIKGIRNISDNAWYMVAMFDPTNQQKLLFNYLQEPAKTEVMKLLAWSYSQV